MNKESILKEAEAFVKERLYWETTGHGYWHALRVRDRALKIQETEGGDRFLIALAALLHDVGDPKWTNTHEEEKELVRQFLAQRADETTYTRILQILNDKKYLGPTAKSQAKDIETKIIQDSDRLDAMGALGVARAFASGHRFNQVIHDPTLLPQTTIDTEGFKKQYSGERKNTTINHFYEKLLLLKDKMETETGKQLAQEKHDFLEMFLEQFLKEWKHG